MVPPIRYAYAPDGAALAYQTVGDGPVDIVYVPQSLSAMEVFWEHPRLAHFFERMSSFARLILFDRRGAGASSHWGAPLALEEQIDDVRTVMDATGAERPHLFALLEGGPMAMLFAATVPERVASLSLWATFARTVKTEGYDWTLTHEERMQSLELSIEDWGRSDVDRAWTPIHRGDPTLRDWLARLQRRSMAPDELRRFFLINGDLDLRPILPSIRVPTLVMHRTDDALMDVRHSRYLAEHIPGARLIEFPGDESPMFLGDSEAVLGEIQEFITGARTAPEPDRILATVLFTDICRSTELASAMGDARWREVLTAHHSAIRAHVTQFGGREIKSIGDGVLATFDGPARAVRAARGIVDDSAQQGIDVRAGLHTGEVEVIGNDLGGMAVHIGARVAAEAAAREVLVSGTVKDLVVGSGLDFEPRGRHELRGVPGEWALWAVR